MLLGIALVVGIVAGGTAAVAADPKPVADQAMLRVAGIDVPRFVHVPAFDVHLRLSGAHQVDHRYLPFHVSALYVGAGEIDVAQLAEGLARCRIAIHWLTHALDEDDARGYWNTRIERTLADPRVRARLAPSMQRFVAALGGAARGDVLTLDYDPDAGLTVSRNGTVAGRFAGLEFNREVLGLWLGRGARADERDALLGRGTSAVSDAPQY